MKLAAIITATLVIFLTCIVAGIEYFFAPIRSTLRAPEPTDEELQRMWREQRGEVFGTVPRWYDGKDE